MSVRTALVLRHLAFEDPGVLGPVLAAEGYEVAIHDVGVGPLPFAAIGTADLLVVLGGPIGVYETEAYPLVRDEITAIAARLGLGRATLGICLGHQMIAAALGASVAPGRGKEIGWAPVRLTPAGKDSVLAAVDGHAVLHWHGDVAELPAGAIRLAETDLCPNQAFAIGRHVLALQFHLEVDPARIEQWLIGHAAELSANRVDPRRVRADTAEHGPTMASIGAIAVRHWLQGLAA